MKGERSELRPLKASSENNMLGIRSHLTDSCTDSPDPYTHIIKKYIGAYQLQRKAPIFQFAITEGQLFSHLLPFVDAPCNFNPATLERLNIKVHTELCGTLIEAMSQVLGMSCECVCACTLNHV